MKKLLFLFIPILLAFCISNAQVLKFTAEIQYEHLQSDEKEDLSDFGNKIEQYYNGYEWGEDEFEYDVECKIRVIFRTVQKKTYEKIYIAQAIYTSNSGETFIDENWEFPYDRNRALTHIKGLFDPVTHVLDYYAYMILAGEMDTNGEFLGETIYNNAHTIIEQGLRSEYSKGWKARKEEFQVITDVRTKPLREVKPDFFEALYLFENKKYRESNQLAKKFLEGVKKAYKNWPNNRYLSMFFNAHSRQIAILFQGQNQELNTLTEIDSKHRETYRKYIR